MKFLGLRLFSFFTQSPSRARLSPFVARGWKQKEEKAHSSLSGADRETEDMSRMNPNASAFVPSWGPVNPPAEARAAAPAAAQTFVPPAQPAQQDAANSWEDEEPTNPIPTSAPAPEEVPPQPTTSVFKVEEDDLEPEPEEGMTKFLYCCHCY